MTTPLDHTPGVASTTPHVASTTSGVASTTPGVVARVRRTPPSRLTARTTDERHWAPKRSGKPDPAGHLDVEQIDALGAELDALREDVLASRGESDARYIRRTIAAQRGLEATSRLVLLVSKNKAAWAVGTAGLAAAKIIENMEIGHNVMHGQWDWMRDPKIHSRAWEWDHASLSSAWRHSHNELHHTYTNVIGADNDLGFGILRVDEDQRWYPMFVFQPVWNVVNAVFFQYSIAFYDLELLPYLARRGHHTEAEQQEFRAALRGVFTKIGKHVLRDYVVHPALSGRSWRTTITANFTANLTRNLWTNAVIICGHFPEDVETFSKKSIENESRGEWYLRQMLGSANISGGPVMHFMTGNLSHQIEHHMYPDLPSNRYAQVAPRVREIFDRYDLHYATGPLPTQLASVWRKVFLYALPNGAWDDLRERPVFTVRRGVRAVAGGVGARWRSRRA